MSELKASLSVELNSIINVNIYITPPSSQGFSPHYDTHEVFVMQIFGTKTWRLYDYKCKYPLKTWELTNSEVKHYIESSPEHEIVLSPGDVLYFPAGVVHDAFCIDELSIHITVGAGSKTVLDFLKYTMEKAEVAEYFRMPLDDGSQESLNKLKSKFSELFDESYSTYNSNNKKLEEKIQDSLFIDYCCVDNINKLGANDVLLSQEDYLPENSLEKVIVSSVKQEKVLEFFSSIPLQERVNYQRSLKGLIRKGVLKFNH